MKFILGKKLNMSQLFTSDGVKIPVTALELGPCKVVQVKTKEKDGYTAIQLGWGKKRKLSLPQKGHQNGENFKYLQEFRVPEEETVKAGAQITADIFKQGEFIDVSGIMKGRGFAGAIKRHGFHGFPATHGTNRPRSVGSIGGRFPQHTRKGKRMPGRMGGHWVTVKNLTVVDVDPKNNLVWVKGAVPGARNSLVKVKTTGQVMENPPKLHKSAEKEDTKSKTAKTEKSGKSKRGFKSIGGRGDG